MFRCVYFIHVYLHKLGTHLCFFCSLRGNERRTRFGVLTLSKTTLYVYITPFTFCFPYIVGMGSNIWNHSPSQSGRWVDVLGKLVNERNSLLIFSPGLFPMLSLRIYTCTFSLLSVGYVSRTKIRFESPDQVGETATPPSRR